MKNLPLFPTAEDERGQLLALARRVARLRMIQKGEVKATRAQYAEAERLLDYHTGQVLKRLDQPLRAVGIPAELAGEPGGYASAAVKAL